MQKNKKIYLYLGVILIFLIILIILVVVNNKNNYDFSKDDRHEKISEALDKAIKLNDLLESNKLDKTASYQNDLEDDCYMYLGDDTKKQIENIEDAYYNFDTNISLFDRSFIEGESGETTEVLYVCPSKKCRKITEYSKNFKIDDINDEMINITFDDGNSFIVSNKDDKFLLVSELYACAYEVPEDKDKDDVEEIIVRK